MINKSLAELSVGLQTGKFSSVELTQHYLDRIVQFDGEINSFITVTDEQALAMAKTADEQIASGSATTLTGIPMAHKDIFCTDGVRTSAGSKVLDNFISPYNATVVEKLKSAGMPMLGKTNMDEFAMGSSNENSFYGACKSVLWRQGRIRVARFVNLHHLLVLQVLNQLMGVFRVMA